MSGSDSAPEITVRRSNPPSLFFSAWGSSVFAADHTTGAVTVTGTDFTDEQVAAAVAEAGYTLK